MNKQTKMSFLISTLNPELNSGLRVINIDLFISSSCHQTTSKNIFIIWFMEIHEVL
uniref:Uncharacterized protein n=1 Tax=Octopus bimaculoides TaxID=37653 RepID=A0A0L8G668_OCTBM